MYNGCASSPTPRSVKARLPRSTLEGGAIEAVLNKDIKIRVFPMIARMADTTLTIDVGRSKNEEPVCNTTNLNMQVN